MNSVIRYILFIFHISILLSCSDDKRYRHQSSLDNYDFTNPEICILPDTLREISGITALDSSTIGCVQDENGILFVYDVPAKTLIKQLSFTVDGDYEGIARAGNNMYILRSDGLLFEIAEYTSAHPSVRSWQTGVPAHNNEGLCYDEPNNRLLIACKTKPGKGKQYKNKRAVYTFDLQTKALYQQPAFVFDLMDIRRFANEENISFATETSDEGDIVPIKFRPSAIAIHPLTHKLFLLSASDHLLFVFDHAGILEHIEPLNPALFRKAEGMTFFSNGDLLISNEGQDKKPTLIRLSYRPH